MHTLSESDFEPVEINEKDDHFNLKLDGTVRPQMTFEDGEKGFYHWACLDTEPDKIIPLSEDFPFVTIGRGEGCTINTSLDDFIDQRIEQLAKDTTGSNSLRIRELKELKENFSFSKIMTSRYHALFELESEQVINLSHIPIFTFVADEDGKLKQKAEIPGLPKAEWCDKCRQIMKELNNQPAGSLKTFAHEKIFAKDGFIKCEACNEKRKTVDFKEGESLVVGNAMYLFQERI